MSAGGIVHFDSAPAYEFALGHLKGRWTALGEAAGCVTVGVSRIQLPPEAWSTPAHEHGRSEEIFYALAGNGVSWQRGTAAAIRPGDCIVYRPRSGPHAIYSAEGIDVLAFGTREHDEGLSFPQLGLSLIGHRAADTEPGATNGVPIQFRREAEHGPPPLPSVPDPRPDTIVNVDEVDPITMTRPRVQRTQRRVSQAAGSRISGLQHVEVVPGKEATAQHCHSIEEEIFVILGGDGTLSLGSQETPVRPGHVISRPAGTAVAHLLRAGPGGLTYLAYGTRDPGDVCYYPRSNKIAFRGVGIIARLEQLDYWDGEDG